MPVIRTSAQALGPGNRPPWSRVTSAGIFRVPAIGGRFDCHFHDCDEYWLVFGGRATIVTEGQPFDVQPGDIVCTRAGDEHDIVAVYEDLEAFWFEDATPAGGRVGHLHRDPRQAAGHAVRNAAPPENSPT